MHESTTNEIPPSGNTWEERLPRWQAHQRAEADRELAQARHRAILPAGVISESEEHRIRSRWPANPTRDFDVFFGWWMRTEAVPVSLDTQDLQAVRGWLGRLTWELSEAWSWYRERCRIAGILPEERVFRSAASEAESIVRRLEGDVGGALPADLPETLLKVLQFIRGELLGRVERVASRMGISLAAHAIAPDDQPASAPSGESAVEPEPSETPALSLAVPEVWLAYDPPQQIVTVNRGVEVDVPKGPVRTVLIAVTEEATRLLDAEQRDHGEDARERLRAQGLGPKKLNVQVQGRQVTEFSRWWKANVAPGAPLKYSHKTKDPDGEHRHYWVLWKHKYPEWLPQRPDTWLRRGTT